MKAAEPAHVDALLRAPPRRTVAVCTIGTIVLAAIAIGGALSHSASPAAGAPRGWVIGVAPFAGLLLSIAILPLIPSIAPWWHHNRNKLLVSLCAAFITLGYLACVEGTASVASAASHALLGDFIPFMALLFALFVVTGGIRIECDLNASPRTTTGFLTVGALLASFVGTTGAAMLLVRPLLTTTSQRKHRVHTFVFFIFLVANIGGTLLPIGDPPLFMGYLRGVPFLWTLTLWREWLFMTAALLALHWIIDVFAWRRESLSALIAERVQRTPLRVSGSINAVWLAAIVLAVALIDPSRPLPGTNWHPFPFLREAILLSLAVTSLLATRREIRTGNAFTFAAILEVAAVFLGIFVTMVVPLEVLRAMGGDISLNEPAHFFWATGLLSSFLDNAPTYLIFLETAAAQNAPSSGASIMLFSGESISSQTLVAVSLGAVFMGANTYIGNGPNFMVRSIAEEQGVRMPSFFGYMLWSIGILIPLFAAVHLLFL